MHQRAKPAKPSAVTNCNVEICNIFHYHAVNFAPDSIQPSLTENKVSSQNIWGIVVFKGNCSPA